MKKTVTKQEKPHNVNDMKLLIGKVSKLNTVGTLKESLRAGRWALDGSKSDLVKRVITMRWMDVGIEIPLSFLEACND